MRAVVAGTFGPIHNGHLRLLETALEIASDGLIVALTSDEFASSHRTREVPIFSDRKEKLESTLADIDRWGRDVEFLELSDPYGVSIEDSGLDAIVVSTETEKRVSEINKKRRERGMEPLVKVVVPLLLAEDGERISSTRVVAGEIDREGRFSRSN